MASWNAAGGPNVSNALWCVRSSPTSRHSTTWPVLQGGALPGVIDINGSEVLYSTRLRSHWHGLKYRGCPVATHQASSRVGDIIGARQFGFHIWRSETANYAQARQVSAELIAARGRNGGAQYEFIDADAQSNVAYHYWLVETELDGKSICMVR